MGTTYVTLGKDAQGKADRKNAVGFWMRDGLLELWLRLLALHIEDPSPTDREQSACVREIRDQWLLASRGHFTGCVPHGLEEATSSDLGVALVRRAVLSASDALDKAAEHLSGDVLNLMGFSGGRFSGNPDTARLRDIAKAFLDLLDGRIVTTAKDRKAYMPGSYPDSYSTDRPKGKPMPVWWEAGDVSSDLKLVLAALARTLFGGGPTPELLEKTGASYGDPYQVIK